MEDDNKSECGSLLQTLPPVDFCCMYGSSLHPNNKDKSSMVDYILGVSDPQQWHSENLKLNENHYGSWIMRLGGARMITDVADSIGVGVHFNPFVSWENKMYKYGVVRMDDLLRDILEWKRFYLSGRLQKPVSFLVDNLDVESVNSVNLKGATTAALLLLPSKFTEEDLYAKICSLSYMGDLRMLFAEDKDKVKKIVRGQFDIFQTMYKPYLEEYATKDLLKFSSSGDKKVISQDCSLSTSYDLVNSLPQSLKHEMRMRLGETSKLSATGRVISEVVIGSREEAAECMRKVLRNNVMASSARQAVAGFLTVGAVNGVRYVARKMNKAWKSRA